MLVVRRTLVLAVAAGVLLSACVQPWHHGGGGGGLGSGNGYVERRQWEARQDDYLRFATEELDQSSPVNVLAHLTRAERDRDFEFDTSLIGPEDFSATFEKIDAFRDTSDFDLMSLVAIWEAHSRDIRPDLREAMEQRFLDFRYWFTDPLPEGVIDNKWFWTENHRIIFHTLEYLTGRGLPHETFSITGLSGRDQAERGRERIIDWLDDRADYGFFEWHSDVYYQEDIEALTLLTEHAEPEIARRAAVILDLFLYDLAVHQLKGNNGVTHGRSYMKDKSKALDQDVFGLTKLLFDTTDQQWRSRSDKGATFLAAANRYKLPEVIRRVATTPQPFVDKTHMGAPLDIDEPFTTDPVSVVPDAPYDEPSGVPFWWQAGAQTAWQTAPQAVATIEEYDLLETELFKPFAPLIEITGGDPDVTRNLAYQLRCIINVGLLTEMDSVTYRSGGAMLSSVSDYRPGCYGDQYHAWQATLDEDAVVFTTLPGNEPRPGDRWVDADKYWTGTGAMPRSAQQGAAGIHLYAPSYAANGPGPLEAFTYLDYTHAYFPTERFDEIRQMGGWTVGRSGDGYVALWSWRPTEWRDHDPSVTYTNGLTETFDLVAPGGANNAWIVEVGDAAQWGSFDAFTDAVAAAPISVTDLGTDEGGLPAGFDVTYQSPTEGQMSFSTTGPFSVDGGEVDLHPTARFDNPFGVTGADDTQIAISDGGTTLELDTERWTRRAVSRPVRPRR